MGIIDGVVMGADMKAFSVAAVSVSSSSSSSLLLLLLSLLLEVVLVRPRDRFVRRLAYSFVVIEVGGRITIACRVLCFVMNPLDPWNT